MIVVVLADPSDVAVSIAGMLTGLLAMSAVVSGIRTYRPQKQWIWYILLLGLVFTSIPKVEGSGRLAVQGPVMALSAIGNLCFVAAPLLFVRARGRKDQDETFGGWTLTLAPGPWPSVCSSSSGPGGRRTLSFRNR